MFLLLNPLGLTPLDVIRVPFTAGTIGTADDVVIFNSNCPALLRILDCEVLISTVVAVSTVQLRDATGGGGNALSDAMLSTVLGRVRDTAVGIANATKTVAAGGTLTLRRSDRAAAGEVIVFVRREG